MIQKQTPSLYPSFMLYDVKANDLNLSKNKLKISSINFHNIIAKYLTYIMFKVIHNNTLLKIYH